MLKADIQDVVTQGALVTVETNEAVRACASGNLRVERGDDLAYAGRVIAIEDECFILMVGRLGRLNKVYIGWSHVLDVQTGIDPDQTANQVI